MIQVRTITKEVQGRKILDAVSLTVVPGEILVIVGPSGSGKSTLLRNISLVERPDAGSIVIDNRTFECSPLAPPLPSLEVTQLYPRVTIVFQQFFLWPHLTAHENIHLALRYPDNRHAKKVQELYAMFDISPIQSKYPNEISVGQKQKVALVRALALEPRYLLLDEVTSALDIESTLTLLAYLHQLKKDGVAIVFVTHALHIAQKIADKAIFLEDGRILESGTKDILFTPISERLRRFVETPLYI